MIDFDAKLVFRRRYGGDNICDIERDVSEAIADGYNPIVAEIPKDEHGFQQGTFEVLIVWHPND